MPFGFKRLQGLIPFQQIVLHETTKQLSELCSSSFPSLVAEFVVVPCWVGLFKPLKVRIESIEGPHSLFVL